MNFVSRLTSIALQVWATAGIAFKRLLTQRFLSLASIPRVDDRIGIHPECAAVCGCDLLPFVA